MATQLSLDKDFYEALIDRARRLCASVLSRGTSRKIDLLLAKDLEQLARQICALTLDATSKGWLTTQQCAETLKEFRDIRRAALEEQDRIQDSWKNISHLVSAFYTEMAKNYTSLDLGVIAVETTLQ